MYFATKNKKKKKRKEKWKWKKGFEGVPTVRDAAPCSFHAAVSALL